MIGAFPETRLIIGCVYRSVGTNAPIPFSVLIIYQMFLDILPTAECLLKSHFIIEMLIEINVAYHIFGLHPPMAVPVRYPLVGESLVNHATLGCQSLMGSHLQLIIDRRSESVRRSKYDSIHINQDTSQIRPDTRSGRITIRPFRFTIKIRPGVIKRLLGEK